jgi:hydroxyacylglutathione hydrolase
MKLQSFGKIQIIPGRDSGRFPFCNSLFIEDDVKVIIDPGSSCENLSEINSRSPVDLVLNTHFHFDHIAYNYIFDRAKIYINDIEAECYRDRANILRHIGAVEYFGEGCIPGWLERISRPDSAQSPYSPQNRHEFWLSTARLDGTYRWGEKMDFGATRMEIIGAPGHSAGFSCPYFPAEGIVFLGDIDLTAFGPWYFGTDSDIDLFIESAQTVAALDAEIYVTAHEEGVLSRKDFPQRLKKYLEIIDTRDEKILARLTEPKSLEHLRSLALIYGRKFMSDDWVRVWDAVGLRKHLDRLIKKGAVSIRDGWYRRT